MSFVIRLIHEKMWNNMSLCSMNFLTSPSAFFEPLSTLLAYQRIAWSRIQAVDGRLCYEIITRTIRQSIHETTGHRHTFTCIHDSSKERFHKVKNLLYLSSKTLEKNTKKNSTKKKRSQKAIKLRGLSVAFANNRSYNMANSIWKVDYSWSTVLK